MLDTLTPIEEKQGNDFWVNIPLNLATRIKEKRLQYKTKNFR